MVLVSDDEDGADGVADAGQAAVRVKRGQKEEEAWLEALSEAELKTVAAAAASPIDIDALDICMVRMHVCLYRVCYESEVM